jgi:hypothetical protein
MHSPKTLVRSGKDLWGIASGEQEDPMEPYCALKVSFGTPTTHDLLILRVLLILSCEGTGWMM